MNTINTLHTKKTFNTTLIISALFWTHVAHADPLKGSVQDAATATPIEDAIVRVLGTHHEATTNKHGRFSFDLPHGSYDLEVLANVGGEVKTSRIVRQYVPQIKQAQALVFTSYFLDAHVMPRAEPIGLPSSSGHLPPQAPSSLPLWKLPSHSGTNFLTVPEAIPRRIRVGRRKSPSKGCRDNPVVSIEEMDLDEYVKGVLPPEIGVFQSIQGAKEVYKAFGVAAKSYGLYFMLHYNEHNRRTVSAPLPPNNYTWFHIDDTACNQRYSDSRLSITTDAAEAVANLVLVKKNDPRVLDKLEYASSCGKHGTLPEYGSIEHLVPDNAPTSPCVGTWCGHNKCAAHQDNPHVPGDDRCLVRGICQWGAAAWGASGKDYLWLLDHYQPNLELLDLSNGTVRTSTVTLTGYAYTNPDDVTGSGVANVLVTLHDGQVAMSNDKGLYTFDMVDPGIGTISLTANVTGYHEAMRQKKLRSGHTNWVSIQLTPTDTKKPETKNPETEASPEGEKTPADPQTEEMDDVHHDMGHTPNAKIGPLLQTSPGIQDEGCTHTKTSQTPQHVPWGLFASGLVGLFALVRHRRQSTQEPI